MVEEADAGDISAKRTVMLIVQPTLRISSRPRFKERPSSLPLPPDFAISAGRRRLNKEPKLRRKFPTVS
jgi:hypothetical protein